MAKKMHLERGMDVSIRWNVSREVAGRPGRGAEGGGGGGGRSRYAGYATSASRVSADRGTASGVIRSYSGYR